MSKVGESREISVAEATDAGVPDLPPAPEGLPEGVADARGGHDAAELGAETGARDDVAGGDVRGRGRDAAADAVTPDHFRAAFRTEPAPGEEARMDTANETGPSGGATHTGGPRATWGHESGGPLDVLGNALAFLWSGWRRVLQRTVLALKREGRQRELGVRVAALADAGKLDAAGYDRGVRAILCQLEQIAEAEAGIDEEGKADTP